MQVLEPMPCIGLAYIAAAGSDMAVRSGGGHVCRQLSGEQVLSRVKEFQPTLVGMTVLTLPNPFAAH